MISELEPVVLAPLLHYLNKVLNLWVIGILEHLYHLNQPLFGLFSSDDHLEDTDSCATFAFPKFGVRVKPLQNVKGLHRMIELAHFITVIGNQIQKAQ